MGYNSAPFACIVFALFAVTAVKIQKPQSMQRSSPQRTLREKRNNQTINRPFPKRMKTIKQKRSL